MRCWTRRRRGSRTRRRSRRRRRRTRRRRRRQTPRGHRSRGLGHRDDRRHRGRGRRRREDLARLIDELELRARRRRRGCHCMRGRRRCRNRIRRRGTWARRRYHDHRWPHRRWRRAGSLDRRRRRARSHRRRGARSHRRRRRHSHRRRRARAHRRRRRHVLLGCRGHRHARQDPPALLERHLHEVVDDILLDDHRPVDARDRRVLRRLGSERHDDVARGGRRYGAVVTRRVHMRRDHIAPQTEHRSFPACAMVGAVTTTRFRPRDRNAPMAPRATGGNSCVGSGRSSDAGRPQFESTEFFQYLSDPEVHPLLAQAPARGGRALARTHRDDRHDAADERDTWRGQRVGARAARDPCSRAARSR
jgi:hypothetical protein